MTATQLRRLRLRLIAAFGAGTLLIVAALVVAAVIAVSERERSESDRRVETKALDAHEFAYEVGMSARLHVDRSEPSPFTPGRVNDPPVVVIAAGGEPVAGPKDLLDADSARRALQRVRAETSLVLYTDEVRGEEMRVASDPVHGAKGLLASVVAVEPLDEAAGSATELSVALALGALGGWLLLVLAGWLFAGRVLGPSIAVAHREEAFLADAAHELRSPVAVIRARAEQALHTLPPGDEQAGALRAIAGAAEQAAATIADMLELARLDARRGRIEREPLRLDLLLEQVLEEQEDRARAASTDLRAEIAGPVIVEGDERLLARALANLVENAIRYGGVGGAVTVSLDTNGGSADVVVADLGPGVPPAQAAAIFDRFHRASSAAGGAGLGLPIARLVAEVHDGRLELLPPEDGRPGARFRLRLPTHGGAPQARARAAHDVQ
jgi:two-component system, OmpR family, sensor kinase